MTRVVLSAAKCSQMSNARAGSGSGGDRCTEACAAMVDATYQVSSWSKAGLSTEQVMFKFTESLNNGSNVSVPENFNWFSNWLKSNTHGQITTSDTVWPSYDDVIAAINRGHICVGGFDDYVNLRLSNGAKPWPWNDPHGLGHVLVIVGYDTSNNIVVVHDPLRADPSGQPADYSFASFQAAGFHDLIEIKGPSLGSAGFVGAAPGPGGVSVPPQVAAWLNLFESLVVAVFQLLSSYFTKGRLT